MRSTSAVSIVLPQVSEPWTIKGEKAIHLQPILVAEQVLPKQIDKSLKHTSLPRLISFLCELHFAI